MKYNALHIGLDCPLVKASWPGVLLKHVAYPAVVVLVLLGVLTVIPSNSALAQGSASSVEQLQIYHGKRIAPNAQSVRSQLHLFEPANGFKHNFGFDNTTTWMLLTFKEYKHDKILGLGFAPLDSVELFVLNTTGLERIGISGDLVGDKTGLLNNYPAFMLRREQQQDSLLIRVGTQSSHQIALTIDDQVSYINQSSVRHTFYAILYGVLITMLLFNILVYGVLKDKTYVYYSLYLLSQVLMFGSINGQVDEFVLKGKILIGNELTILSFCALNISSLLFTSYFLRLGKYAKGLSNIFKVIMILVGFVALTIPFLQYAVLVKTTVLIALISCILILIAGYKSLYKGQSYARFFVSAWTLYLITMILLILQRFGVLGNSFFLVHLTEVGAVVETFLITLALIDKFNTIRSENEEHLASIKKQANELKIKTIQLEGHAYRLSHILRKPVANIIGLVSFITSREDFKNDPALSKLDLSGKELDEIIKAEARRIEGKAF